MKHSATKQCAPARLALRVAWRTQSSLQCVDRALSQILVRCRAVLLHVVCACVPEIPIEYSSYWTCFLPTHESFDHSKVLCSLFTRAD